MQIDPDAQTTLALSIARLRSMRAIEWLSALLAAAALAIAALVSANDIVRILLALSVVAALITTYACIRVWWTSRYSSAGNSSTSPHLIKR